MATSKDKAVLESIFHPHAPFGGISAEEEQQPQKHQEEEGAFDPELLEQARILEHQGVTAAEAGDVDGALERLDRAIQQLPERASTYNNRAQALRLKGEVASALKDLDVALKLSKGTGHVACQAFVQRALIRRLQGCEEEARRDLEQAASLGSPFAHQQLVRMNPYAALCNQMLSEVMGKLRSPRGEPQPSSGGEE
ncbi:tetratricopeptide repeat protein 36 [Hemicordylus capensis]|uniref:tetratricopeptide repeat protein 36 n=1 Tax=Hemicordylus capensis TaxID=884348 RepID=UPI0023031BA3|nr:tetratricopeptide repeat protein 36 [Hemicordylus capensis]